MRNRNSRRRPGRPKGHPKTGGRKPGTKNKVTVEGRAAAAEITDDPTYRRGLVTRARKGQLGPMEVWLWRMAKGNPTDDSVSFEELLSFVRYVTALFLDVVQDARLRQQFALGLRRKLPIGTDVGMDFVKSVPEIAPPIAEPNDDEEYLTI